MKLDPEYLQIEDLIFGSCTWLLLMIISIFCYWAGLQVLEDYSKRSRCKLKKMYKKISIYQNQDEIL